MTLKNPFKRADLFTQIVILGAITISLISLYFSYSALVKDAQREVLNHSNKIRHQVEENLAYIANLSNFVSNQIANKEGIRNSEIATILVNTRSRINQRAQDIMTWTLFDFVNNRNYVVASCSQGMLREKILITQEQRSWITESRITPWTLLHSSKDVGIVSGEKIIPFGFGITKESGEFVGILSAGINIDKLKHSLESLVSKPYIKFILTDKSQSVILASSHFQEKDMTNLESQLHHIEGQKNITLVDEDYYHIKTSYQFHLLTGIDKTLFLHHLYQNLLPKLLNTLYLTIFLCAIFYFLKIKLLQPIKRLSRAIRLISQGKLDINIPQSRVSEVNNLSISINQMKDFLSKEEDLKRHLVRKKNFAEDANYNKTEFLASTAHELKNMLSGIVGIGELIKMNLIKSKDAGRVQEENIAWINDIIKLGEESTIFVNDILDINQAQTGNFKIEMMQEVDLVNVILRSIKLLKNKAISQRKTITSNCDNIAQGEFLLTDVDPRRMKQIIVNIISNAIKYSHPSSIIDVNLRMLSKEEGDNLEAIMQQNIQDNEEISHHDKKILLQIIQKRSHNRICIEIVDEGIGMSADELQVALTKYGTIKNQNQEKVDSTGLGLPIVKYLVEMQGGFLEIISTKGKGTSVKIIF